MAPPAREPDMTAPGNPARPQTHRVPRARLRHGVGRASRFPWRSRATGPNAWAPVASLWPPPLSAPGGGHGARTTPINAVASARGRAPRGPGLWGVHPDGAVA